MHHRFLSRLGIRNVVVDAASMKVDRKARRAKSDRLDVRQMLADLVRYHRGDKNVWSVVHVSDEEQEDDRRRHRGLERLKKERTSLRSRVSSLLATEGIHPVPRDGAIRNAATLRSWAGAPLLPGLANITRALELDPNNAMAYYNRGNARRRQGDLAGAVADYDRALALDPQLWQAWANRGIALAALGRREEAAASFERALELAPPSMRPQGPGL